ncbi:MAG: enoyl-CoA hydratase/isomerase family protein [Pseudonocardia sp.]|nr:enoyl-CoA hydratase/isomerase family protein [Pseudonocardia sp.]
MTGTTAYSTIALDRDDRVAHLTLDRPGKLNALDPRMLDELLDALAGLAADETVNALVVTGRGRLFSAGVDLSTPFFMEQVTDESIFSGKRLLDRQHRLIEALYGLPFLTVASVNGDAVGGGGFGMAMACDLRIAVRTARFWMVPSKLAVVQDFGLSWLVQRQIGPSRTLQMAVLGQPVTAATGADWGLVNELVDDQAALSARVAELAGQLNELGTDALRMLKLVVRNGATSPLHEQLRMEAVANGLTFQSTEFTERKAAYLRQLHGKTGR